MKKILACMILSTIITSTAFANELKCEESAKAYARVIVEYEVASLGLSVSTKEALQLDNTEIFKLIITDRKKQEFPISVVVNSEDCTLIQLNK